MTAKEALHDRIEELTDEEAEELLARIEWEATEEEELSDDELALLEEGNADFARGDTSDGDAFLKRLGL